MTDNELVDVLKAALKDGLHIRDDLYLFNTQVAWDLTNQAHVQEPQRMAVFAALEAHPQIQPILGMYLNRGLNGQPLTRENLGDWLLTRAMKNGPEAAVAQLRPFVDSSHCDLEEYLAFSGLGVSAPTTLPGWGELIPMSEVPESALSISLTDPEWSYFGRDVKGHVHRRTVQTLYQFGTNTLHANPHVAMAALRLRHKRTPAFLSTPSDFPTSLEPLLEILLVLAAATSTAIFPVAHWVAPTPTTPLWKYFSWRQWSHLNALREFKTYEGNENRIISAITNWAKIPDSMKHKLRIPLDRLNRALAASSAIDCAIDLGLALEALLLSDLEPNDQISLAFRLRGAWLLGKNPTERQSYLQKFNAIYTCRSKAVHRGTLPPKNFSFGDVKVSPGEFMVNTARQLAASAVLKVIDRGSFPDWNSLLVGVEDGG
ncbi:MAG TPA: hypothetical protein VIC84_23695 [Blastocatellia bacterium]|jgi:hypothetical protein